MEKKINLVELLKDCPQGMELDCVMFDDVKFINVEETEEHDKPICIKTGDIYRYLTKFGTWTHDENAKCIIFPKGKTTWEGFRPFKDGDVVATELGNWIAITGGGTPDECMPTYCVIKSNGKFEAYIKEKERWAFDRLATEEEKEKLFQAIKDNGYRWNAEKKYLEKSVKPKFKVGNRITNGKASIKIGYIDDNYYYEIGRNIASRISITEQNKWRLDKFDISTLVPFESRVLVKSVLKDDVWKPAIFGHYSGKGYCPYFVIGGSLWAQCIPYEGNEHLLGTKYDCDEYYKTWE